MSTQHPAYPQPGPPPGTLAKNGLGTAGFVTGLIGLVFSPIPVVGMVAWPLVIIGLVLSILGVLRARRGVATNKGLSIAGIACSATGLVICILWAAAIGETAQQLDQQAESSASDSAEQDGADTAEQDGGATESAGVIGEPVRDGQFEFTVTDIETGIDSVGDGFSSEQPQGQFVIVDVSVHNIGDDAQTFTSGAQNLIDSQEREFDAASATAVMALPDSEAFLEEINPGNAVDGQLLFDVPDDVELTSIELHDSPFSGGVVVDIATAG